MWNRKGSSLLELMLYIASSALLITVCFTFLSHFFWPIIQQSRSSNQLITLYVAQNLFVKDLRTAFAQENYWKRIQPQELIWHNDEHDIGWYFHDNKLVRISGEFDQFHQKWIQGTKSVALQDIDDCTFSAYYGNKNGHRSIQQIQIDIAFSFDRKKQILMRTVILSNGVQI